MFFQYSITNPEHKNSSSLFVHHVLPTINHEPYTIIKNTLK